MEPTSQRIFNDVKNAMQQAEELGGPNLPDYVRLMAAISHECTRRIEAAVSVHGYHGEMPDGDGSEGGNFQDRALIPDGFELFGCKFRLCSTGGNCMALVHELGDGRQVLLTDGDAYRPEARQWCASFYDKDGAQFFWCDSQGNKGGEL